MPSPLGRYYLYFADHKGRSIRLAYADALLGPRAIHAPGSLQLAESHFATEPPAAPRAKDRRVAQLVHAAVGVFLLYAVAGESGIAIAAVHFTSAEPRPPGA